MNHFEDKDKSDPFDLNRFLTAQHPTYAQALGEIRRGRKDSHWMWFVFPQLDGLAGSPTAQHYAIKSGEEARAYLAHSVLGARLRECAEAVVAVENRTATQIFGHPDNLKLKSCATLFAEVSPPDSIFQKLLEKFYNGERDTRTLALLK